jgi:hypothetical protein
MEIAHPLQYCVRLLVTSTGFFHRCEFRCFHFSFSNRHQREEACGHPTPIKPLRQIYTLQPTSDGTSIARWCYTFAVMESLLHDFHAAYMQRSGPMLAATLTPAPPVHENDRLVRFYHSSNEYSITQDIRSKLFHTTGVDRAQFSKGTSTAWVAVYTAFWKANATLVHSTENIRHDWSATYRAWKDLTTALNKGYNDGWFESWTVPCLYVVGRYLRIFAIKADDQTRATAGLTFDPSGQEDHTNDCSRNSYLEDAARLINRIFMLCMSDR